MLDICKPSSESGDESRRDANDLSGGSFSSKLPDPWLFDSDALIRELDRIRETALQVPTNGDANATHFGLQMVVNAAWTLRENLRYLLSLHREGQRSFRKQHQQPEQSIKGAEAEHQTIYALFSWVGIRC